LVRPAGAGFDIEIRDILYSGPATYSLSVFSIYYTPRCIEKYPAAAFIENGEEIMKVGFAVQANEGIESKVFNHFGSAPVFIIVDAASSDITTVNNQDLHHVHGACNPIKALDGQSVDAMVVGGIGAGALSKLNAIGIKVYGSSAVTVKENLALLNANKLQELFVMHACRGHEGGCGH
jgi:ArsR family transcriptional regulator